MKKAGYSDSDIWGYNLRQLNAHVKLSVDQQKREHLLMAQCARIAYHADGKGFSKFTKELGKNGDGDD